LNQLFNVKKRILLTKRSLLSPTRSERDVRGLAGVT